MTPRIGKWFLLVHTSRDRAIVWHVVASSSFNLARCKLKSSRRRCRSVCREVSGSEIPGISLNNCWNSGDSMTWNGYLLPITQRRRLFSRSCWAVIFPLFPQRLIRLGFGAGSGMETFGGRTPCFSFKWCRMLVVEPCRLESVVDQLHCVPSSLAIAQQISRSVTIFLWLLFSVHSFGKSLIKRCLHIQSFFWRGFELSELVAGCWEADSEGKISSKDSTREPILVPIADWLSPKGGDDGTGSSWLEIQSSGPSFKAK